MNNCHLKKQRNMHEYKYSRERKLRILEGPIIRM
jgi:hypothetical protein